MILDAHLKSEGLSRCDLDATTSGKLLCGFCVVALLVCIVAVAQVGLSKDSQEGPISISSDALQIGDLWAVGEIEWNLPLENKTDSDIRIVGLETPCECSLVGECPAVVRAGSVEKVRLLVDFAGRLDSHRFGLLVSGRFEQDGKLFSESWLMTANVHALPVNVYPEKLTFDCLYGEPFIPASREATIQFRQPVKKIVIVSKPKLAETTVARVSGHQSVFRIKVVPKKADILGVYAEPVLLKPIFYRNSPSFRNDPVVSLPVRIAVEPLVQAYPNKLLFGRIPVGEEVSEIVTLDGRGCSFTVHGARESHEMDVTIVSLKENVSVEGMYSTYEIRVTPSENGTHSRLLRFDIEEEQTGVRYNISAPVGYVAYNKH